MLLHGYFDPVVLLIAYCGGGVAQRFLPLLYCYYFVCTDYVVQCTALDDFWVAEFE